MIDSLLLEDFKEIVNAFVKVIWYHLFLIIEQYTVNNLDDTVTQISRQEFTTATAELYAFFKSIEYKSYLHDFFGSNNLSKVQILIGSDIVLTLYSKFLAHLSEKVNQDVLADNDVPIFNVWEMTDDGKGKVRYVAGWALKKVMQKCRNHVKRNMHSKEKKTLEHVQKNEMKAEIIQNELCAQYTSISS